MKAQENGSLGGRFGLLRETSFRRLLAGAFVSLTGDQFTLLAMPWLVLKFSGDAFAVSIVMIVTNLPRILFLLIGGALVDRFSAKRVLVLSLSFNGLLVGLLALLVMTGRFNMGSVYALALGIGFATAFSIPSWLAIVRQTMAPEHLTTANSIIGSATQISAVAGPILAGAAITAVGHLDSYGFSELTGLGFAFAVDFGSFVFALWALFGIATRPVRQIRQAGQGTWSDIRDGLRYFWRDRDLRTASLYGVTIALFVGGPMQVAIPVLAKHWDQGASAFGIALSASGIGSVVGVALFGIWPKARFRNIGTTMLLIDFVAGVLIALTGQADGIVQVAFFLAGIGILMGFVQVMVMTWIQGRVPPQLLGRVMSVFILLMMSVPLLSIGAAGWLMRTMSPSSLITLSGLGFILIVLAGLVLTPMSTISDLQPAAEHAP